MARIEDLADRFGRHIATPWQRTVSGAQRVIMVVYDKELERTLRARKVAFETAARQAGRDWYELDISNSFAAWMAADDYREEYFASPEDLQLKLQAEFSEYVAELLRTGLTSAEVTDNCVVALVWGRYAVRLCAAVSYLADGRGGYPGAPGRLFPRAS